MKKVTMLCVAVVLVLGVTALAFAQPKAEPIAAAQPMGAAVVEVVKIKATVEKVDVSTRMVTLKGPKGNLMTFKADEAVKNLEQVKVGDKVVAQYLESVAVFVRKSGDPPSAGELDAVGVAPKGAKPGVVMVQTEEVTAKVQAVDVKGRTITLMGPEGKSKKFKVDKSVKRLNEIKKGDDITLRVTQALAIEVVKP
jgi:hypothetical protein